MSDVSGTENLAAITQAVWARAMVYCAEKMPLGDTQAVLDCLKQGDGQARAYCYYSVAKQVARALGALDENIKAAYIYDYDTMAQDLCFGEGGQALPIHLLVWAERKTAALKALAETWDRALAQSYAQMTGRQQPGHLLDVQVVDSADVEKRIGYAALLSSLHHRPIEVWKR